MSFLIKCDKNDFLQSVASPGFVARRAKIKFMSWGTEVDFGAGYSSCSIFNSFVTNAVLIERAVSC